MAAEEAEEDELINDEELSWAAAAEAEEALRAEAEVLAAVTELVGYHCRCEYAITPLPGGRCEGCGRRRPIKPVPRRFRRLVA